MSIFDPVMAGKRLNFGDLFVKVEVFQISEPIPASLEVSDMQLSRACSLDNYLRDGMHLRHLRRYYRCVSSGKPKGQVCRSALALAGRPLPAWEVHCCLQCCENEAEVS